MNGAYGGFGAGGFNLQISREKFVNDVIATCNALHPSECANWSICSFDARDNICESNKIEFPEAVRTRPWHGYDEAGAFGFLSRCEGNADDLAGVHVEDGAAAV